MEFHPTSLKGMMLVKPRVFRDHRGIFLEAHHQRVFEENGIQDVFVQDNLSRSGARALRGMHYQLPPHSQAKLVRVVEGEAFVVGVDIRRGSPSFGRWHGERLSAENHHALYLPPGFAHGFCVTGPVAQVYYKCSNLYSPSHERSIRWDDLEVGIRWPVTPDPALMTEKDLNAPLLKQAEIPSYF